ncbi:hypothetical protein PG994_005340 [Apiospora phragmitis]|uniref:Uncharacterized protein n=1 Tax=Apiospora phragmitis TaxID=2905665 RepID=A0ABR1VBZ3_9PEZI
MHLTTFSQVCPILLFSHLSITYLLHYANRWSSAKQVRESRRCKEGKVERLWDILGIGKIIASVKAVLEENPSEYLDTLWDAYGDTYVASFLGVRVAFTRDAANLKHVLNGRWLDFDAAKNFHEHMMRDCQVPERQTPYQKQFIQSAARVPRNVAWLGNLGPLSQYLPQGP